MSDITQVVDLAIVDLIGANFSSIDPPSARAQVLADRGVKPIRGYNERIWMNFLRGSHTVSNIIGPHKLDKFLERSYGGEDVPEEAKLVAVKWERTGLFEDFEIREEYYDPALFGILDGKRYLLAKWGDAQNWSWLRRYRQANMNWWDDQISGHSHTRQTIACAVVLGIPFVASMVMLLVFLSALIALAIGQTSTTAVEPVLKVTLITWILSAGWCLSNVFGWLPVPLGKDPK